MTEIKRLITLEQLLKDPNGFDRQGALLVPDNMGDCNEVVGEDIKRLGEPKFTVDINSKKIKELNLSSLLIYGFYASEAQIGSLLINNAQIQGFVNLVGARVDELFVENTSIGNSPIINSLDMLGVQSKKINIEKVSVEGTIRMKNAYIGNGVVYMQGTKATTFNMGGTQMVFDGDTKAKKYLGTQPTVQKDREGYLRWTH